VRTGSSDAEALGDKFDGRHGVNETSVQDRLMVSQPVARLVEMLELNCD
jgi:hypothetical protein